MVTTHEVLPSFDNPNSANFSEQGKPTYQYLDAYDFDELELTYGIKDPQGKTLEAYKKYVKEYARVEWSLAVFTEVWRVHQEVFKLVEGAEPGEDGYLDVLVGGDATGRDVLFFFLLNQNIRITGYDAVHEMVAMANEMLGSDQIKGVIEFLLEQKVALDGLVGMYGKAAAKLGELKEVASNFFLTITDISQAVSREATSLSFEVIQKIEQVMEIMNGAKTDIFKILAEELVKKDRINMFVADHRELKTTDKRYHRILHNATWQHLSKTETREVLARQLTWLRDGGLMIFNLRYSDEGKVFCDNRLDTSIARLGDIGIRYYTTYTREEIAALAEEVRTGAIFRVFGIDVPEGVQFELVTDPFYSDPVNQGAPGFVKLTIKRLVSSSKNDRGSTRRLVA